MSARLDEIAEGIAAVLQASPTPDPLYLDLIGHSPAEVTFLVRAVIDACERRGSPLSTIHVAADIGSNVVRALGPEPLRYEGVQVQLTGDLSGRVAFFRFPAR